jgi:hypothetical protein
MHTTGIIHHFNHSNMYMNTGHIYIQLHMAHSPCCEFPLLVPFSTYLAPSRCDRNGPPQSQVARKLIPFVPHCSLVPSPPNSQPFLGFPELNVHLIKAASQTLFPVYNTLMNHHYSHEPSLLPTTTTPRGSTSPKSHHYYNSSLIIKIKSCCFSFPVLRIY